MKSYTTIIFILLLFSENTLALQIGGFKTNDIKLGGKNSIFDKPLGVGPGSINKALQNLKKTSDKAVNDFNNELSRLSENEIINLRIIQKNIDDKFPDIKITADLSQFELDEQFFHISRKLHDDISPGKTIQKIAIARGKLMRSINMKAAELNISSTSEFRKYVEEATKEGIALAENLYSVYLENKQHLDQELTKMKKDLDRELTKAKKDTDKTITIAREDFVTELNQLGGKLCGQSNEQLAIQRKYDQGEITLEEYDEKMAKAKKGQSGSCGGGFRVSTNEENINEVVLTDGQGNSSEKEPIKETPIIAHQPPINYEQKFDYILFEIDQTADTYKPPFTNTPLGQILSPESPASDIADATPTQYSEYGGYPGMTRSRNTKYHGGFDDPSTSTLHNETVKYYGTKEGTVTKSGPAYTSSGTYLGERVTIEFVDNEGIWETTTMHHKKAMVIKGAKVQPGEVIAIGSGVGEQFDSPEAGKAHVHWRLKLNGKDIDPLEGNQLKRIQ